MATAWRPSELALNRPTYAGPGAAAAAQGDGSKQAGTAACNARLLEAHLHTVVNTGCPLC